MKVRFILQWSDWLVGVDWADWELRAILGHYLVHFRFGPFTLQLRGTKCT